MNVTRTLYLDMDGVLVDFDKEFCDRFQVTVEEKESLSRSGFWEVFNTNSENFFLNAPPFAGIQQQVERVVELGKQYHFQIEILTALPRLSRYPAAKDEKRAWLKNNGLDLFPFNIGPYAPDKWKHCRKGDILIDDNVLNIVQWNAAGGIGIFHVDWKNTLKYLEILLEYEVKESTRDEH